ncbi:hypothetical protein [Bacillus sp. AK128]
MKSKILKLQNLLLIYWGKFEALIKHVKDRPGYDRRYAIDNSKIKAQIGLEPNYTFEE